MKSLCKDETCPIDLMSRLDSVVDDINAYGSDLDLQESFCLYRKAGGKYFSELVPNFYAYEE